MTVTNLCYICQNIAVRECSYCHKPVCSAHLAGELGMCTSCYAKYGKGRKPKA